MVPQELTNIKKEIPEASEEPMLSFEDFYLLSGPSNSSNQSVSPGETPSRIQHLLDDPLILQELVIIEKSRSPNQDIDLNPPAVHPCHLITWSRFRDHYLSDRIHIRFKQSSDISVEESMVLVMRPEDQLRFCHMSKDVKVLTDWTHAPPFLTDLVNPLSSDKFAGYALLIYDTSHGWELAGRLTPFSEYEIPGNLNSFQEMAPESTSGLLNSNIIPIKVKLILNCFFARLLTFYIL